jgi:hypothetical protein
MVLIGLGALLVLGGILYTRRGVLFGGGRLAAGIPPGRFAALWSRLDISSHSAHKEKPAGPAGFESESDQTNQPAHTQERPQFKGLARLMVRAIQTNPARETFPDGTFLFQAAAFSVAACARMKSSTSRAKNRT